jgi:aspartate 1-decarboxylase
MQIELLKSKIHRATITATELHYEGSIAIDEDLMDAAHIIVNEKVDIYDINNGERLETYVIKGKRGSGEVAVNGAAARKVMAGDLVIIVSYATMDLQEAQRFIPTIIYPDNRNKLK